MYMKSRLKLLYPLFLIGLCGTVSAQNAEEAQAGTRLAAENSQYLVNRLEIPLNSSVKILAHGHDVILVASGEDSTELKTTHVPESQILANGDVRFISQKDSATVSNHGNKSLEILVIELKQHWNNEIRPCSEFAKCTRPIRIENNEIGETTSLFTNGFITAYRHRLAARGTLTSTYYSSKGKDHLLLIPLTDLRANFDGTDETLKHGQVYPSEATEIEVNAETQEIRWVVIRVQVPAA
jgi:hypothetical protein